MAFTVAQKTNCVSWFIQTGSITQTQRNFQRTYRTQAPARNNILRWVKNFQTTGGWKETRPWSTCNFIWNSANDTFVLQQTPKKVSSENRAWFKYPAERNSRNFTAKNSNIPIIATNCPTTSSSWLCCLIWNLKSEESFLSRIFFLWMRISRIRESQQA